MHYEILDAYLRYKSIPHIGEEFGAFAEVIPHPFEGFASWWLMQPSHAAIA
jgi:hypothetical protein